MLMIFRTITLGQSKFDVRVNINGANGKTMYLRNFYGGNYDTNHKNLKTDSVIIQDNRANFTGEFTDFGFYSIALKGGKTAKTFIIDTGITHINANDSLLFKAKITHNTQEKIRELLSPQFRIIEKVREKIQDSLIKYTDKVKELEDVYSVMMNKLYEAQLTYLFDNIPKYPNSFYLINKIVNLKSLISDEQKDKLALFSEKILKSPDGELLLNFNKNRFHQKSPFLENEIYALNGSFEKLKFNTGKIYIIDYWASWCNPCVAQIPKLKSLYSKYHEKGLEVISISLDVNSKSENWKKSINQHQIPWLNYRETNGFESPNVLFFGFNSIPRLILLNAKGFIINSNLAIEDAENTIENLLDKK